MICCLLDNMAKIPIKQSANFAFRLEYGNLSDRDEGKKRLIRVLRERGVFFEIEDLSVEARNGSGVAGLRVISTDSRILGSMNYALTQGHITGKATYFGTDGDIVNESKCGTSSCSLRERYDQLTGDLRVVQKENGELDIGLGEARDIIKGLSVELGQKERTLDEIMGREANLEARLNGEITNKRILENQVSGLRTRVEPLYESLEVVERVRQRMEMVYELLGERELTEILELTKKGVEDYISNYCNLEGYELEKLLESVGVDINAMKGYSEAVEKIRVAEETISLFENGGRVFNDKGDVIDRELGINIFGQAISFMPKVVFQGFCEERTRKLPLAQKAFEEGNCEKRRIEEYQRIVSEVKSVAKEFTGLEQIVEQVRSITTEKEVIPFRLEFEGEDEEGDYFRVTIPVLLTQSGKVYEELKFWAMIPLLEDKFQGIELVEGKKEEGKEFVSYLYRLNREERRTNRELAARIYDIAETMTALLGLSEIGQLGNEVSVDCRFQAGRLREKKLEAVIEETEGITNETKLGRGVILSSEKTISYAEEVERLRNIGKKYGLDLPAEPIGFGLVRSGQDILELYHLMGMRFILGMTEQGLVTTKKINPELGRNVDELGYERVQTNEGRQAFSLQINNLSHALQRKGYIERHGHNVEGSVFTRDNHGFTLGNNFWSSQQESYLFGAREPIAEQLVRNAFDAFVLGIYDRLRHDVRELSPEELNMKVLDYFALMRIVDGNGLDENGVIAMCRNKFPMITQDVVDDAILRLADQDLLDEVQGKYFLKEVSE